MKNSFLTKIEITWEDEFYELNDYHQSVYTNKVCLFLFIRAA